MVNLNVSVAESQSLLKTFGPWVYSVKTEWCLAALRKVAEQKKLATFIKMSPDKKQLLIRIKGELDEAATYKFDQDTSKIMINTGVVENEMQYFDKLVRLMWLLRTI